MLHVSKEARLKVRSPILPSHAAHAPAIDLLHLAHLALTRLDAPVPGALDQVDPVPRISRALGFKRDSVTSSVVVHLEHKARVVS